MGDRLLEGLQRRNQQKTEVPERCLDSLTDHRITQTSGVAVTE